MFEQATVFDQDLKDWDVSKGTTFVSYDQAIQLFNLLFSVLPVFRSWMLSRSNFAVWQLGTNNLTQHRASYFLFSR
jgi:hypothetical protein